ncbi:hypothetical protein ABBQ38_006400 [Trebouxia sp. C0009 RCD-2024]
MTSSELKQENSRNKFYRSKRTEHNGSRWKYVLSPISAYTCRQHSTLFSCCNLMAEATPVPNARLSGSKRKKVPEVPGKFTMYKQKVHRPLRQLDVRMSMLIDDRLAIESTRARARLRDVEVEVEVGPRSL